MKKPLFTAIKILLAFTFLTGVVYPLAITGIAQLVFPHKSNGSIVMINGQPRGSELIGQTFNDPRYFSSRPSAGDYNAVPSSASNLGPTSDSLKILIENRRQAFIAFNHLPANTVVPNEMETASGSGLDPHISPESAYLQMDRICSVRGYSAAQRQLLQQLIVKHTEKAQFGVLGEPRVNVLALNCDLDLLK
ncbi:MAG: potassium-transporting ATPase subunit KdpC [Microbacter sp.]